MMEISRFPFCYCNGENMSIEQLFYLLCYIFISFVSFLFCILYVWIEKFTDDEIIINFGY